MNIGTTSDKPSKAVVCHLCQRNEEPRHTGSPIPASALHPYSVTRSHADAPYLIIATGVAVGEVAFGVASDEARPCAAGSPDALHLLARHGFGHGQMITIIEV